MSGSETRRAIVTGGTGGIGAGIARVLLDKGWNVQLPSHHGNTTLHTATARGFLDIVTLLLNRGADIHTENDDGDTGNSRTKASAHGSLHPGIL